MAGTGAFAACNDFVDFVQALASQVETLKALPEKVQALEARIAELEAVPRSGLSSPSSDLLGECLASTTSGSTGLSEKPCLRTWERPSADKQQPQQQQKQQMQPTDLLGIETPPAPEPKPLLRQTPPPVPQQQQQQQNPQLGSPGSVSSIEQDKVPLAVGNLNQDPLILADPWASKSVPVPATLQVKPPPPVAPGPRLQVKPPPTAVSGTGTLVGASGLLVKPPPFAIQQQKALQAVGEVVPGVSVDEASKAAPPVKAPPEAALRSVSVESPLEACREPTSELAVKQLPCKAPPKQLLLKAEQPPGPPPTLSNLSEAATGVSEVPSKALPTKLIVKAPPPQFAR